MLLNRVPFLFVLPQQCLRDIAAGIEAVACSFEKRATTGTDPVNKFAKPAFGN